MRCETLVITILGSRHLVQVLKGFKSHGMSKLEVNGSKMKSSILLSERHLRMLLCQAKMYEKFAPPNLFKVEAQSRSFDGGNNLVVSFPRLMMLEMVAIKGNAFGVAKVGNFASVSLSMKGWCTSSLAPSKQKTWACIARCKQAK